MTADKLDKILDRLHKAIGGLDAEANCPNCLRELDQVWRDLNRERALMKDAERRPPLAVASIRSRVLRNSSIPVIP